MKSALRSIAVTASAAFAGGSVPLMAEDRMKSAPDAEIGLFDDQNSADPQSVDTARSEVATASGDLPPSGTPSVFDKDWINIGIGAGLVPTYAGSDDYFVFPVPLVTGRLGGIGFRPSGAGMIFDVLSPQPTVLQQSTAPQISLGPAFRVRVDRAVNSRDPVVEAAGRLDNALELGLAGGVTFPGVLHSADTLTAGAIIRWDVLGAHKGQVIEPYVAYLTPLSLGILVQLSANMEIVDDNFARYYQTVTPAQSAASGLPLFDATGGINRIGVNLTTAVDLDGNALNGGLNIFAITGYSRMLGDGAATPFTSLRGTPDQFLAGVGIGYTF
jgi:MipA family protein